MPETGEWPRSIREPVAITLHSIPTREDEPARIRPLFLSLLANQRMHDAVPKLVAMADEHW